MWLVRAAQAGDREAMTLIYERTRPQINHAIRAIVRDESLAEDVAQETYLRAFANIDSLREPEKLLPWLRVIAQNQAKNALQKQKPLLFSELTESAEERAEASADTQPELMIDDRERAELIRQALDELGDGQRLIIGMYYFEQLSVAEIAEKLGISQSTVKSQLHRGRRNVARVLRKRREKGEALLGLAAVPKALRQLEGTGDLETRTLVAKAVEKGRLSKLAQSDAAKAAAEVAEKSGKSALLTRLIVGAVSLGILGGVGYGVWRVMDAQRRYGDVRPPETVTLELQTEPTETDPPETETDPPETEPPETDPPEIDQPETETEEPTEPPTEKATQRTTESPGTNATEQPTEETAEDELPTLPVDLPYEIHYQTVTGYVGETWTGKISTDEKMLIRMTIDNYSPGEIKNYWDSAWSNGVQTVTIHLNEPGVFDYRVCRNDGYQNWIPWVTLIVIRPTSP